MGPNGEELEEYTKARGFHIGAAVSYKFTDLVGMRAEFVFSQRGTIYNYDGPSYYVLGRGNVRTPPSMETESKPSDAVQMPFSTFRYGILQIRKLRTMGGVNTGILLASTAGGSTEF